ncbi:MAG: hypothetical protein ACRC6V_03830 [Bacteroidales bacterium]
MIVFSADPGTKNFAIAVADHRLVNGKIQSTILGTGMLTTSIFSMTGSIANEMRAFENSIVSIRKEYKPELISFERFQSRGLKGTTIECINMMLALMVRVFRHQDPRLILASTWKNRINKKTDLKALYKEYGLTRKHSPKTCHELDATLIGYYATCRHFGLADFENFSESNIDRFMEYFLTTPKL